MIRRLARRILGRTDRPAPTATAPAPRPAPVVPPAEAVQPVADAESLARLDASAQEIVERVGAGEPVVMLDVRSAEERRARTIAASLHIPLDQLAARWEEVKDCDEIVCFSDRGDRSREATVLLRERGVFNATSLEGGLAAWVAFGGPVVTP